MPNDLELEIFRAGDYGAKGVWGEAELERIAVDYNPALHEAPVTVDHAQCGPALGWVTAVRRVGDRLVAHLRGLNLRFLELLRSGAFKKRSAEIYPRLAESGGPYLRAVSFLGAGVPEVKGLADPDLAIGETDSHGQNGTTDKEPTIAAGGNLFAENEGEYVALEAPAEAETDAEVVLAGAMSEAPLAALDYPADGPSTNSADYLAGDKALNVASGGSDLLSQPVSFAEVSERLRASGQWRPAWREHGIEAFFAALPMRGEIPVGEGRALTPAEWFAQFLESLPVAVALGEAASATAFGEATAESAFGETAATVHDELFTRGGFTRGGNVDPESMKLHRAAVAFMAAHPGMAYSDALVRCAAGR